MPNRFAGQYNISMPKQDPMAKQAAEKKRKQNQQLAALLAMGLPIAGTIAGGAIGAFGGPGGAMAGAGVGGTLGATAGNAASQYFANEGESAMESVRKREMERMALMQAIQGMRGY